MATITYNQTSFLGGISAQWDATKVGQSAYPLLINGRVRRNVVEGVRKPARENDLPDGEYQGMYAAGSVLFVAVSGQVYWRDISTANSWSVLGGITIEATGRVYMTSVPASTINIKRTGSVESVAFTNSRVRQTPEAILVTDGVNQPSIIYPTDVTNIDGRATQTYDQWIDTPTGELREYVPVGLYPTMVGKRLFMAIQSDTGRFTRIGASCTGRPLDFVVRITEAGNKDGNTLTTPSTTTRSPPCLRSTRRPTRTLCARPTSRTSCRRTLTPRRSSASTSTSNSLCSRLAVSTRFAWPT